MVKNTRQTGHDLNNKQNYILVKKNFKESKKNIFKGKIVQFTTAINVPIFGLSQTVLL